MTLRSDGSAWSHGGEMNNKKRHPNWTGHGDISGRYWRSVTDGAKNRGIYIGITVSDAWDVFCAQDGKCIYTGQDIAFEPQRTASLDRRDSGLGYITDNVQWVHAAINRMKWKLPENDFLRIVYMVCFPVSRPSPFLVIPRESRDPKWTGSGNIPNWLVGRFKNIAKRRGIPFGENVDADYLWNLYEDQRQCCALTGLPICFSRHSYQRKQTTASLDRIDSSHGYVRGNLQWLHKDVNNVKGSLTDDRLREMCRMIFEYSPLLAELSERRAA